jgi:hypothetical protein
MNETFIQYLADGSPERYELGPERPQSPEKHELTKRIRSFLKAVSGPRVNRETYVMRLATCAECPKLVARNGKLYCGACGCPKWKPAELTFKAKLENADCPLSKWPKLE